MDVTIIKKKGKYGLQVAGNTHNRVEVSRGDPWHDDHFALTFTHSVWDEWTESLALEPKFDRIEQITDPGHDPPFVHALFYIVQQNGQQGLYCINGARDDFVGERLSRGPYEGTGSVDCGFLLSPTFATLDVKTDRDSQCLWVTADGRRGILSSAGSWVIRPSSDDLIRLEPRMVLVRSNDGGFAFIKWEPGKPAPSQPLVRTQNWRKMRNELRERCHFSWAYLNELEQRVQPARKSPVAYTLASFFLPGLGTILCGKKGRGLLILGLSAAALFGVPDLVTALNLVPAWGVWSIYVAILLWIWGMIDAYRAAQQWNREHSAPQASEATGALGHSKP